MNESLQTEIERFDPSVPIEAAWMPPSSWYLDPQFLDLEYMMSRVVAALADIADPYASALIVFVQCLLQQMRPGFRLVQVQTLCRAATDSKNSVTVACREGAAPHTGFINQESRFTRDTGHNARGGLQSFFQVGRPHVIAAMGE